MRDQHDTKTASMDMSTLIGYARVSTAEQSLEMQIDALKKAGCHRSLVHLVQTIDALRERGVGFRSLTDAGIDTTTRNGKLLFNLFATLAEFERDLISERTKASLAVAKARGRSGGRRATVTPEKLAKARRLMDKKGLTVKEAAAALDVGRSTLYRALNAESDAPTEGDGGSPFVGLLIGQCGGCAPLQRLQRPPLRFGP